MPRWSDAALPLLCLLFGMILCLASGPASLAVATTATPSTTPIQDDINSSPAHEALSTIASQNQSTTIAVNTTFVIAVDSNGDARWTVIETFNRTTDRQREAFEALSAEYVSEDVSGYELGFDAFVRASERVDAVTERNMSITGERRESERNGTIGELHLSFTWENFARVQNGDVILDDVYETDTGLWFEGLAAGQQLIIQPPDGYGFGEFTVSERTSLEDQQLNLEGPVTFTNETLQAVLVGDSDSTVSTPETPAEPTPDDGASSEIGTFGLMIGGFGVLGVTIVAIALTVGRETLVAVLQKEDDEDETTESDDDIVEEDEPTTETTEPEPEPGDETQVDTELLSDEERVERLLEQNGGRMKQANIVKETGWSNAKVSQLLSSMEEEQRVDKLRIGRENLISFPDEDVTEIGDE